MEYYFNSSKKLSGIDEAIECYSVDEFESPFRSTIYLFAFIKSEIFNKFLKIIGVNQDGLKLFIEYDVNPIKGKGKASFTDLMVMDDIKFISIEAKNTEPEYEKVKEWLNSDNKKEVLNGWLELINNKLKSNVVIEDIKEITYQMIHRLASSCSVKDKASEMIYIYFGNDSEMEKYYVTQLNKLILLTNNSIKISFYKINPEKLNAIIELEKKWNDGSKELKKEIISGLKDNSLLDFKHVIIKNSI